MGRGPAFFSAILDREPLMTFKDLAAQNKRWREY